MKNINLKSISPFMVIFAIALVLNFFLPIFSGLIYFLAFFINSIFLCKGYLKVKSVLKLLAVIFLCIPFCYFTFFIIMDSMIQVNLTMSILYKVIGQAIFMGSFLLINGNITGKKIGNLKAKTHLILFALILVYGVVSGYSEFQETQALKQAVDSGSLFGYINLLDGSNLILNIIIGLIAKLLPLITLFFASVKLNELEKKEICDDYKKNKKTVFLICSVISAVLFIAIIVLFAFIAKEQHGPSLARAFIPSLGVGLWQIQALLLVLAAFFSVGGLTVFIKNNQNATTAATLRFFLIVIFSFSIPVTGFISLLEDNYVMIESPDGEHQIVIAEDSYFFSPHGGNIFEMTSDYTMKNIGRYKVEEYSNHLLSNGNYEIIWQENGFILKFKYSSDSVDYEELEIDYVKD